MYVFADAINDIVLCCFGIYVSVVGYISWRILKIK